MWISKSRYERIMARLQNLERAVDVPYSSVTVGKLARMLLDHHGLHIERIYADEKLVKKGGPERG